MCARACVCGGWWDEGGGGGARNTICLSITFVILCIYFDNLVKRSVPSLVGNIPGIEMTDILINMPSVLGVTRHEVAGALD